MAGKLRRGYVSTAIVLLNFACIVVLLNVILGLGYWVVDTVGKPNPRGEAGRLFRDDGAPIQTGKRDDFEMQWFDYKAYDVDVGPAYVGELLDDFYEMGREGFVYQPWVQFSEPPYNSRLLNVDLDERGLPIRRTLNPAAEADTSVLQILALGGSTTFGYYVADEHTWPTALSRILNARARAEGRPFRIQVINYGRGFFNPSQQAVLLQDLLKSGHRPSLVIFMDGLNWGAAKDQPHFTPQAAAAFIERQHGSEISRSDLVKQLRWVPMVRLAAAVDDWIDARTGRAPQEDQVWPPREWRERASTTLNEFEQAHAIARAVCKLYGCEVLFILQPNTHYGYNLNLYRMQLPAAFTSKIEPTKIVYDSLKATGHYVDLSGLFQPWGADRKAVIDDIHYSPGFSEFLAEHVADHIDLGALPVFDHVIDEAAATGDVRSVVTRHGVVRPRSADAPARRD